MNDISAMIDQAQRERRREQAVWTKQRADDEVRYGEIRAKIANLPMHAASVCEYANWLYRHLNLGGTISHVYDYPMRDKFYVAECDFVVPAGACGALSFEIIVPAGITVKHEGHDHRTTYDEDSLGKPGVFTPLYPDVAAMLRGMEIR